MLRADVQRIEIDNVEDWTISRCVDGEKSVGTEMHRTFPSKHEIHLRLRITEAGSVELDAMNSEIGAGDWESLHTELRVNEAKGEPVWSGKGAMIEDADGLSWVRLDFGEHPEDVLVAMMEGGQTLFLTIGTGSNTKQWEFSLKGAKKAYDVMWEANQKASR